MNRTIINPTSAWSPPPRRRPRRHPPVGPTSVRRDDDARALAEDLAALVGARLIAPTKQPGELRFAITNDESRPTAAPRPDSQATHEAASGPRMHPIRSGGTGKKSGMGFGFYRHVRGRQAPTTGCG